MKTVQFGRQALRRAAAASSASASGVVRPVVQFRTMMGGAAATGSATATSSDAASRSAVGSMGVGNSSSRASAQKDPFPSLMVGSQQLVPYLQKIVWIINYPANLSSICFFRGLGKISFVF